MIHGTMNLKSAGRPRGPEKVAMKLYVLKAVGGELVEWYGRHKKTGCGLGVQSASGVVAGDSGQSEAIEALEQKVAALEGELALKAKETAVVPVAPAVGDAASLKTDNIKLMDENAQLLTRIEKLKALVEEYAAMAPNEKYARLWAAYDALRRRSTSGQYDQTAE